MSLYAVEIMIALPAALAGVFFFARVVAFNRIINVKGSRIGSFRAMCFCFALAGAAAGGLDYYRITHATHSTFTGRVTDIYETHGRSVSHYMDVAVPNHGIMEFFAPYQGPKLVKGEHVSVTAINHTSEVTDLLILDGPGTGFSLHHDAGLSGAKIGLYLAAFAALLGLGTYLIRGRTKKAAA